MNMLLPIAVILSLPMISGAQSPLMRVWTSASGSKIRAEFVKSDNSEVTLKTADGKQLAVRQSALSPHDLDYLPLQKYFVKTFKAGFTSERLELQYDAPAAVWLTFQKWMMEEQRLAGTNVCELRFTSESQVKAWTQSPIEALGMEALKANIIDLKKQRKDRWFVCTRRSGLDQFEDNLYGTRLWGDTGNTDAYFTQKDFGAVRGIPEDAMENRHGPIMYYVYGQLGVVGERDGLLIGELAEGTPVSKRKPLPDDIREQLIRMTDANWAEIRDSLLNGSAP
ncbi:MAG: SHD1 domain-containing protein [Kiritimatiellae bacterium]|nr:SHD1 domain-containing protein [Kiritimatiellia bacterium]